MTKEWMGSWASLLSSSCAAIPLGERELRAQELALSFGLEPKEGESDPLALAFETGMLDMAPALIALGAAARGDGYGQPPLSALMKAKGSEEELTVVAKALVAAGCKPAERWATSSSAPQAAVSHGNINGLRALAGAGVDLSVARPFELSALHLLALRRDRVWSGRGDQQWAEETLMARELVGFGADVNQRTEGGHTALLLACESSLAEMALTLIEMGADPSLASDSGADALSAAVNNSTGGPKMLGVFAALLKAGANPDQKGLRGLSARDRCARLESGELKRALEAWDEARELRLSVGSGVAAGSKLRM